MSHLDDCPHLVERHELVRDREAGQYDERDLRLTRQRLLEVVDPARIHEPRADVARGADDGRVAVALGDADDDVSRPDEHEVRGERRARQPVEQRRVVALGRPAEMGERRRAEAVEVERGREEVARDGQLVGYQREAVLEAGEVEDGVWAVLLHAGRHVAPGLLQLAEVVFGARQDATARVRETGGVLVPVGVGRPGCDVDHVHGPILRMMASMAIASYVHGTSSAPLLGETIGESLRRAVERHGDREALVVRHQRYRATYAQLWEQVDRAARGLLARGVEKGDRVGIWAPNRHEWVVVQYATARIGAILVNVNPAYKATELEYALRKAGVSVLVLARGFRQTDYVEMLAAVRAGCPALREAIVLEDGWEALLGDGDGVDASELAEREAGLQFDDPINIQYTSGTTGFPKGATLSHHNVLNNGYFIARTLRYDERRPGLRARSLLPLLRHGDRQPRLPDVRRLRRRARPRGSTRSRRSRRWPTSGAPRCTACRRCSSPSSSTRASASSICRACGPASWQGLRARSRRCVRCASGCTWTRSRSATG